MENLYSIVVVVVAVAVAVVVVVVVVVLVVVSDPNTAKHQAKHQKTTSRRHGRHDLLYTNSCRRPRRSRNKPKTTPRRHGRHKNIIILKCKTGKCRPQAPCMFFLCILRAARGSQPRCKARPL